MADRTSLTEDEGTLTRSEVRKERDTCPRCGAPMTPVYGHKVCGYLATYGHHRDRAE